MTVFGQPASNPVNSDTKGTKMPPKLALAVAGSRGGRRGGGRGAGRGGVKVGAGPGRAADATAVEQKREASSSEKDEHKYVHC